MRPAGKLQIMVRPIRPRLTAAGKHKITISGQPIPYTIKHSARARHVRLEVRHGTDLTVVIPVSYKIRRLPDLLQANGRWILDKLARYGKVQSLCAHQELKSGDVIPYLGHDLEVVIRENHHNVDGVKLERDRLVVSQRSVSSTLNLAVEQWYRMQAAKLISERVNKLSARLGVTCNRVIIRGQKTRWGSCSQKGNLSFNWKLMMAPEPVIDYVIIHELAHLKEMNHSKRFWELVAQHCHRWRAHKKWLRQHEANLTARLRPRK